MTEQGYSEGMLSIIIINYNGRSFLQDCLESVVRHVSCPHEVILVDNNSHDGSAEYVSCHWPEVRLVASTDNLGFARGNNLGAEHASGRYLLLLNNDTKILESIQPLINYLEDHEETAIVGGRLCNPDGSIQPSTGYDHTPLRLLFTWMVPRTFELFSSWQLFEKRTDFYRHSHGDVHWVSGAFLCIRKSVWQELGGFDRDIFMYVEDVDLCRRARLAGKKIAFVAAADTCHFEGGGKKGLSGNALLSTVDSYRLLLEKHYGSIVRTLTCGTLSAVFLVRSALYLLASTAGDTSSRKAKAGFYLQGSRRLLLGSGTKV